MRPVYLVMITFLSKTYKQAVRVHYRVAKKEDVFQLHDDLKNIGEDLQITFSVDHIMKPSEIVDELKEKYDAD